MKIKLCPLCHQPLPQKTKETPSPQKSYYQRNKDKIKAKLAEKRKDPEYRRKHNENAKKSYHKNKEVKNARTKNEI